MVAKGQEITFALLERLKNCRQKQVIPEQLVVRARKSAADVGAEPEKRVEIPSGA